MRGQVTEGQVRLTGQFNRRQSGHLKRYCGHLKRPGTLSFNRCTKEIIKSKYKMTLPCLNPPLFLMSSYYWLFTVHLIEHLMHLYAHSYLSRAWSRTWQMSLRWQVHTLQLLNQIFNLKSSNLQQFLLLVIFSKDNFIFPISNWIGCY